MIDAWIPCTGRMLHGLATRGVSGTGTYRSRDDAAAAAVRMAQADPEGPTFPVLVPKPIHRTGPEGLRVQLAVDGEIAFDYVNWRGERAVRRASGPYSIRYGTSEYHAEPQFLLSATDLERGQPREYALRDMVPVNL
jgi:hypothetical protein